MTSSHGHGGAIHVLPLLVSVFKIGLGLPFPLAVVPFALFDVTHLVETSQIIHLDNRAVKSASVGNASYALPGELKRKAGTKVRKEYRAIASYFLGCT